MLRIAGDSTSAVFPPEDPRLGWGAVLEQSLFFVKVDDAARSGRSSKSYRDEGHWAALEERLEKDDLVLIAFGHNDEKDDPARATDPKTTFRDSLRSYVADARRRGAIPVLVTPLCRRRFENEELLDTHGAYPEAIRAVAMETETPLVDLSELSRHWLRGLGEEASLPFFAPDDNTHLSPRGARAVAELVACALARFDFGLPARLPLWPAVAPVSIKPGADEELEKDGRLFAVREPALEFYPAPVALDTGAAVVICPGGGYRRLCMVKEGSEVAAWLNGLGVNAFVLRYRLQEYGYPAPLKDVLRSLRLVRSRAAALSLDRERVGVLGFSAGGHVAASASALFADPDGASPIPDAVDALEARPSFAVLLYPVITLKEPWGHAGSRQSLLGPEPDSALIEKLSLEDRVSERTPPTFLMHTRDDASVPVDNTLLYRDALARAGVPFEVHLYDHGPHGIGLRPGFGDASRWPEACAAWLRRRGILRTKER
jgi:acetyl esterase/lipase/lysophospholipase L1-like esterase